MSDLLKANMWQLQFVLAVYAIEINRSAIFYGTFCSFIGAFVGAIIARPVPIPVDMSDVWFVDKDRRIRKLTLSSSQFELKTSAMRAKRFQFGIGRILIFTTCIAFLIALLRMAVARVMSHDNCHTRTACYVSQTMKTLLPIRILNDQMVFAITAIRVHGGYTATGLTLRMRLLLLIRCW